MSYSTDLLDKRVEIWNRSGGEQTALGKTSGSWKLSGYAWAGVTWNRGAKSMREGALDAYDTVMIRLRWRDDVDRDTRIKADGKMYAVETLQGDRRQNVIQLLCAEVQE